MTGTKEELRKIIKNYLIYDSIRDICIEKMLKKKDYDGIISATNKWIEEAKKEVKWLKIQYEAYKAKEDLAGQKNVAEKLVFEGIYEYYDELKELYDEEFSEYYPILIKKIKEKNLRSVWIGIATKENDVHEIMEYIRKYPYEIDEYVRAVKDEYFEEAEELYKDLILIEAEPAGDREHYRRIVKKIVEYKNCFGLEKGEQLVALLLTKYKRRRTFKDELNNALGGFK